MYDIKWIRDNPDAFSQAMQRRGYGPEILDKVLALDTSRRDALTRQQNLQAERNDLSKQIGQAKRHGEDAEPLMARVKAIKEEMEALEAELESNNALNQLLATLPNKLEDSVPDGEDEEDNQFRHAWGDKPSKDFTQIGRAHV